MHSELTSTQAVWKVTADGNRLTWVLATVSCMLHLRDSRLSHVALLHLFIAPNALRHCIDATLSEIRCSTCDEEPSKGVVIETFGQ